MRCEWKKICLQEIIDFKNGKKRPNSTGNIPVYGGNGILDYTGESNNSYCVIIGRVGAYCGSVFYEEKSCWISDNAISAQAKSGNDVLFTYYLLKSLELNKRHIGTSQPLLTQEILNRIECYIPPLIEQKSIAAVLSLLDDKIKINNAINNNLEQQAQALYQHMFIDSPCTEWRKGSLSDIAEVSSGKRPPMKSTIRTNETAFPIVGAADVMGFTNSFNHNEKILIIGRVGTHGIIQRFNSPCWTSDNTLVITSNYYEYVYQILRRIDYHSLNRGSTQPLITQSDINKVPVLLPDNDALIEYETLAGTLMSEHEANVIENTKLSEIRDTLLPRLMSGKIDVSEIDI